MSWKSGYALPEYVEAETPGRGVFVTDQLPDGTVDTLVPSFLRYPARNADPYNPGYALPKYVKKEGFGRAGAMVTRMLPRGTISAVPARKDAVPLSGFDAFTRNSLSGSFDRAASSLSGSEAWEIVDSSAVSSARDSFARYGDEAANIIIGKMRKVPAANQRQFLAALLDFVKPGLSSKVDRRVSQYLKGGSSYQAALREALKIEFSSGLAKEVVDMGRGVKPATHSMAGMALSGIWGKIKSGAKKVGRGAKKAVSWGVMPVVTAHKKAFDWFGDDIISAVKGLGGAACKVLNSSAAPIVGAAGAAAAGGAPQYGVVGARIGAALCANPPPAAPPPTVQQSSFPIVPVALVGGAVALALILTR